MDNTIRTQADVVRLLGEYVGTLQGVLVHYIPDDLRKALEGTIPKIRATEVELNTATIDNVTVTNLDIALRMCKIQIAPEILDRIIDLVELIEVKSDDVSIKDIISLQEEWKKLRQ